MTGIIRLWIPIVAIFAIMLRRVVSPPAPGTTSYHCDVATTVMLGLGSTLAMYHLVGLASSLCAAPLTKDNLNTAESQRAQMIPWHIFLAGAVGASIFVQLVSNGLNATSDKAKQD